jgi:hypothetical protein
MHDAVPAQAAGAGGVGWRVAAVTEIMALCSGNAAVYEASRVKRFFAINISSLPRFQEAH